MIITAIIVSYLYRITDCMTGTKLGSLYKLHISFLQ